MEMSHIWHASGKISAIKSAESVYEICKGPRWATLHINSELLWRVRPDRFFRNNLYAARQNPQGVSREELGTTNTTSPIQVDHTPAVTMLHALIALIHSQTPL